MLYLQSFVNRHYRKTVCKFTKRKHAIRKTKSLVLRFHFDFFDLLDRRRFEKASSFDRQLYQFPSALVERTLTAMNPVDDMVEVVLRFVPNIVPPVGDVFNQESFILRSGGGSHDQQREQEDDLHG